MDYLLSHISEQNVVSGLLIAFVIYLHKEVQYWKKKHTQVCQREEHRLQSFKELMQNIIEQIKDIKNDSSGK